MSSQFENENAPTNNFTIDSEDDGIEVAPASEPIQKKSLSPTQKRRKFPRRVIKMNEHEMTYYPRMLRSLFGILMMYAVIVFYVSWSFYVRNQSASIPFIAVFAIFIICVVVIFVLCFIQNYPYVQLGLIAVFWIAFAFFLAMFGAYFHTDVISRTACVIAFAEFIIICYTGVIENKINLQILACILMIWCMAGWTFVMAAFPDKTHFENLIGFLFSFLIITYILIEIRRIMHAQIEYVISAFVHIHVELPLIALTVMTLLYSKFCKLLKQQQQSVERV